MSVAETVGTRVPTSAAMGASVSATVGRFVRYVGDIVGGSAREPVVGDLNDRLPICLRLKSSFSESNQVMSPFEATTHKIFRRNRLVRITESFMFSNRCFLGI